MEKIKIVNVVSRMVFGGVESVLYNYYSNMDLSKFELYIITMKSSKKEAIEKFEKIGFKFFVVDDWEKEPVKVGKDIMKILEKNKFDIIHSHLSHTNFYFMYLAQKAKINIRISHSHLSVKDNSFSSKVKHALYKKIIKIYSTDFVACGIEAAQNLYGSKKDVLILNNAIDAEKFRFSDEIRKKYRNELKIGNEEICLGTVGRMTEQKNQLFLIDIFNEILKFNNNFKLIIVGDGNLKDKINQKIKEKLLKNKVIILKDRNDVNNIMQAFDLFILPSLYEGLPLVGIEAQSTGLNCYFSDTIDKNVDITGKSKFLTLESGATNWAKDIINNYKYIRKDMLEIITDKGFNIKSEAKKLEIFYIDLINRRNKK